MKRKEINSNEKTAQAVIAELIKCSVKHFLISPGSRSTPLVCAIASHTLADVSVHFDERGLAFHGLGISKSTETPSCIVVTSGTALANLYPAIIEASMDNIPLIILSADRPFELLDTKANQTITQTKMFSQYLRWEIDIPAESIEPSVLQTNVDQAFYRATSIPAGPVLLNMHFREPFSLLNQSSVSKIDNPLPKTYYFTHKKTLEEKDFLQIKDTLLQHDKGLIIAGQIQRHQDIDSIYHLALKLQWPVFADVLSGMRSIGCDSCVITHYNHILQTLSSHKTMAPETILLLGGPIVSKSVLNWIKNIETKNIIHVADFPERFDPHHVVTDRVEMHPIDFCQKMFSYLPRKVPNLWMSLWKEYSLHIQAMIEQFFQNQEDKLSEPYVIYTLRKLLTDDISIFFGNSLTIRYADTFLFPPHKTGKFYVNRGVSGIDGNLATVFGISKGAKNHVLAVVGDLTFLHDINSLTLMQDKRISATIIVLNNGGGGIFHFLPINDQSEDFEKYFVAKHNYSIQDFAQAFHIHYENPKTKGDFQEIMQESIALKKTVIIEVKTNSRENLQLHEDIESLISQKLPLHKKETKLCYFSKKQ